jgi:hypothetical protein
MIVCAMVIWLDDHLDISMAIRFISESKFRFVPVAKDKEL